MSAKNLTIGKLAAAAGVNVETVRYYQREGLLGLPRRELGAIRRYDQSSLDQLRFIKRMQAMGFSLAEAATLLGLKDRPCCRSARDLAAAKLDLMGTRIAELSALRSDLMRWVATCDETSADAPCPNLSAAPAEHSSPRARAPFAHVPP